MSIRKPNFPSFLLPVVLVSFAPLLVNATPTTPSQQQISSVSAVCSLPADAPAQFQARFAAADTTEKQAICAHIAANHQPAQPDPAGLNIDRHAAVELAIQGSSQTSSPSQDSTSGDIVINAPSSADTLAAIRNKSASGSVDSPAPAPQPVIDPKPVSVVLSPSKAHYLNSTDAQSIFSDLSIVTLPQGSRGDGSTASKPTSASLAAIYPNACKDNFSVSSTSSDRTLNAPSGTIGFAIFDTGNTANGGLVQCMHDHAGDCDQDYSGTACSSMSGLAHVAIAQDVGVQGKPCRSDR
jgi:hypothetical protein